MKRVVYFAVVIISIVALSSCSTESTPTYTLSVTAEPAEAGTVSPASGEYEEGEQIEVSATANDHWVFTGWQGDHSGTSSPITVSMDSDKQIRAMFTKQEYPLTVETVGEGTVQEQLMEQKTTDYEHGTAVELTAVPAEGWAFIRWEGDRESQENPLVITVEEETNITAVFEIVEYPLTVSIEGEGEVFEQVVQSKMTDYPGGTVVELTGVPDENWAFSKWSGDLDGEENPATITIDEPKEVTATFLRSYTLTTVASPEEGGTVTPESGGYVQDTTIEVKAEPNEGWEFVEWEGDFSGSVNPFNLTMNGDKTITANFEREEFELNTEVEGQGTITEKLNSGTATDNGYLFESEVELEAVADENWNFSHWEGDLSGSENPINVTFNEDLNVTAVFIEFEDGDGSVENPFQVANVYQLQRVGDYLDKYFIQIADIDASDTRNWVRVQEDDEGFIPIGSLENGFTGSYNGQGHKIVDLYIQRVTGETSLGLFGYNDGGTLTNIDLDISIGFYFSGYGGGLVGLNNGAIENVVVSAGIRALDVNESYFGVITGLNTGIIRKAEAHGGAGFDSYEGATGGFAGRNEGEIIDSFSTGFGRRGSPAYVGVSFVGFVGENAGIILRSYSIVDTPNDDINSVAGLVNYNSGIIDHCYTIVNIPNGDNVAGLVLSNHEDGKIRNSYSTGNIRASGVFSSSAGGLVSSNSGEIIQSYSENDIYAFSYNMVLGSTNEIDGIGGLVGFNSGKIMESYSIGTIEVRSGANKVYVGGITGVNNGNGEIINSYSLKSVLGIGSNISKYIMGGIVGENTAQITQSFSTGTIEFKRYEGAEGVLGSSVGIQGNTGSLENNYYDSTTSGISEAVGEGNSQGVTGLETGQITGSNAEVNMDFDWESIWKTVPGEYPIFQWQDE